ncbi:MAG: cobalamin-binding protein [Planctomycetota bacterium]|nr:MAG: cobalamin-binding protein [Planctomycetota bacterium]
MPIYFDHLQRRVEIPSSPQRVASFVPSQTELLFDLGLGNRLVGITRFCVHPKDKVESIPKIGGTKKLNLGRIRELKPHLIIANKEENNREELEVLEKEFPVWVSHISTWEDNLHFIQEMGRIFSIEDRASQMIESLEEGWKKITPLDNLKTIYLIWKKPFMSVGGDTYIHALLEKCGFQNLLAEEKRYPEVSLEKLQSLSPQVLILPSEPYPFGEKESKELQEVLPQTSIFRVDGQLFCWYGSRLLHSFVDLRNLIEKIRKTVFQVKNLD